MNKKHQDIELKISNIDSNKNLEIDRFKTTNVNILLNRVKKEKKKSFKKKFFFSIFLATAVSLLGIYFIN